MAARTALSLPIVLLVLLGAAAHAAELQRLTLDPPKGVRHGAPFVPGGLAIEGNRRSVTRFEAAAPHAAGRKTVRLTVLRERCPKELAIKPALREGFGERFPFDDPQAERLRKDVVAWVAAHQKKNGFWPGNEAVNSCLAGLCLLGTRDRKHGPALRELVAALLERNPHARDTKGFSFWSIAYQGIFFCEYHLATGDRRALTWVRDAIDWLPSTTHPSKWGMQAFGHSPSGLPYGEKALMAPCSHLLVFEALAEMCGVESGVWKHIKPYVMHNWSDPAKGGHGAMGYNASAKDLNEFWSRTGLTALALDLRAHHKPMRQALTKIMVERHPWMLNSHAYGEPGGAWGLIALARVDPKGFAQVLGQWRWRFLGAWEPGYGLRYSTAHMGAPYMGEDEILNPAYGVLLSVLNRYRDGSDSMGWHADDEPELGPAPTIASLSLGAVRTFQLKHRVRKDVPRIDLDLAPGSLLVMRPPTQAHWLHGIPKRRGREGVGERINLTFRTLHGSGIARRDPARPSLAVSSPPASPGERAMPAKPSTVKEYLDSLPEDRRKALRAVRAAVNRRLPKGYKEGIQYGMIGWFVPHRLFPGGYHCDPKQPVPFAGLASQKNYMSLYLMCIYGDAAHRTWFEKAWARTGKKLDMGKSCVRFKTLEDIPLDLIEEAVARVPVDEYIAHYEASIPKSAKRKR